MYLHINSGFQARLSVVLTRIRVKTNIDDISRLFFPVHLMSVALNDLIWMLELNHPALRLRPWLCGK